MLAFASSGGEMETRMKIIRLIGFAAIANGLGCSVDETVNPAPVPYLSKCQHGVIGDPKKAPEIEILTLTPGQFETVTDGASVSLAFPPAAGSTLFAGARVRNMDPCGIRIRGEIADPVSGQIRIDTRIINMEPTDDGWASSSLDDIYTTSNLAVCPNQWAMQDIFDNEFQLTMIVTDRDQRIAWKSLRVVPRCDIPGEEERCKCQCSKDYLLGQICSNVSDAGP
jgi:hypothetical protein